MQRNKINLSVNITTSAALILIGASLVKYQSGLISILIFVIGIFLGIIGFIELVNFIAQHHGPKKLVDVLLSVLFIIAGILIAIFNESLAVFSLIVVGLLLIAFGVFDLVKFIRFKWRLDLVYAIIHLGLGVLVVVSHIFSTNNELLLILGYAMISLGGLIIVLDTF